VDSFLPLVRLKHEDEFIWGEAQKEAFDKIKRYLRSPPVLRMPKEGKEFRLIVASQERMIGVMLTQEDGGKDFVIAYLSRRLLDTEARYKFIEKMCLSLYYACTKLRRYLLTSSCTIMCQYDIIKYMLQRPILSGSMGKWAFALVEYDLEYERLTSKGGQVVVDFIVEHRIELENDVGSVDEDVWKLFFDDSVHNKGHGIGCFIVSPNGVEYELSIWLEFECTNNQAEYEALLSGLPALVDMEAKNACLRRFTTGGATNEWD
jgi:hypothetical protein